jgi:hypothetical protein
MKCKRGYMKSAVGDKLLYLIEEVDSNLFQGTHCKLQVKYLNE